MIYQGSVDAADLQGRIERLTGASTVGGAELHFQIVGSMIFDKRLLATLLTTYFCST